jgi:hypothetical protein
MYTDLVFLVGIWLVFLGIYRTNTKGKLGRYISVLFFWRDTAIIDAWEHRHVREDDDAYEGRINLGTPNDVTAAYEREDQRAAVAVRPSSGRRSGSFDGQHIPPTIPPRHCHTEGGEGITTMDQGNPSKDRGIGRQGRRLKRGGSGGCDDGAAGIDRGGGGGGGLQWLVTRAILVKYKKISGVSS